MKAKVLAFTCLRSMLFLIVGSVTPTASLWANSTEGAPPSPPSVATLQSTYGKLPPQF